MALFNWQNGSKTQNAVVTQDGVTVQDAVWEGETPLSASNLNSAQDQLVSHIENEINTNIGTATNTWSSSSSYNIGDRVIYAGGVYENLTGSNSSAPNIDTTNWKLIPIINPNGKINVEAESLNEYSTSTTQPYSANYSNTNFQTRETVLYNNTSGSNGTIQLSDSAANYKYIKR